MVTFARGDIVRLRSDEQEAERCEGESSREYHRARRYIVVLPVTVGATFRMPNGSEVRWPRIHTLCLIGSSLGELDVPETDLIATGERAEEIA